MTDWTWMQHDSSSLHIHIPGCVCVCVCLCVKRNFTHSAGVCLWSRDVPSSILSAVAAFGRRLSWVKVCGWLELREGTTARCLPPWSSCQEVNHRHRENGWRLLLRGHGANHVVGGRGPFWPPLYCFVLVTVAVPWKMDTVKVVDAIHPSFMTCIYIYSFVLLSFLFLTTVQSDVFSLSEQHSNSKSRVDHITQAPSTLMSTSLLLWVSPGVHIQRPLSLIGSYWSQCSSFLVFSVTKQPTAEETIYFLFSSRDQCMVTFSGVGVDGNFYWSDLKWSWFRFKHVTEEICLWLSVGLCGETRKLWCHHLFLVLWIHIQLLWSHMWTVVKYSGMDCFPFSSISYGPDLFSCLMWNTAALCSSVSRPRAAGSCCLRHWASC